MKSSVLRSQMPEKASLRRFFGGADRAEALPPGGRRFFAAFSAVSSASAASSSGLSSSGSSA